MSTFTKYILFTFFILIDCVSFAQDYTMTVVPLGYDEGLNGNRISSSLQDQNGFIWLTTQNGLARFDGHDYLWFNKATSRLRDIPKSKQIAEDAEGYIWLNQTNKIDLIHRSTFEVVYFEEIFKEFEGKDFFCRKIIQGPDGSVLISIHEEKKSRTYLYHPNTGIKELEFLHNKRLTQVRIEGNELWYTFKKNWRKYNIQTGKKLKEFKTTPPYDDVKMIEGGGAQDYFFGTIGKEWVLFKGTKGEIKELVRFPIQQKLKLYKNDRIFYDKTKGIFIAFLNNKLNYIDLKQQKLVPISILTKEGKRFFSKIFSIDSQGFFWGIIGGDKGKLSVGNLSLSKFKHYIPNHSIRGLWVNDTHIFSNKYIVSIANPNEYTPVSIQKNVSIETNIKDELWQGKLGAISNVHSEDGVIHPSILFSHEFNDNTRNIPWSILRDQEGRWWSGVTGKKGIAVSGEEHPDSLYVYDQYNEFEELKNAVVVHLLENGEYIWGLSSAGIHLVHKQKGIIHRYFSGATKEYQLPLDNVHFLHKDANDVYWAATNASGLVRFELDERMQVINHKTYTTKDGLSSNTLYTIVEDDKERLWISTLHGLTCLDRKTEKIQTFFGIDGLPETEFNRISHAKGTDGRIYFGTINGIIAFYPDEIVKNNTYDKPLTVTKFEKYENQGKRLTDKTQDLIQNNQINLYPSDRFMRLDVSLKDYFNAQEVRYFYKVEGLFDSFQFMDGNTIEIGGLPYGKYKLVVRGQGANRLFSAQELSIPLIVVKPFYLTWWFIGIVLLLLLFSGLQIYFWRVKQLEERKSELELLVQERTSQIQKDKTIIENDKAIIQEQATQLKELDELKSRFFANISHELRTPLTLILAPLSNLFNIKNLSNKEQTQLLMMRQNGQKLLKRINELLDLSRLDANKLEVIETPTFLYVFFKTVLSTFESAANIKNVQLLFDYHLNENVQILIDNDKLEKIMSNFLSNALKFTPKDGTISLTIDKHQNNLQVQVKDTGIGIPSAELNKIFDRFYQSKNDQQQQGTGIGLSLCQELAKVLKGRVWATSELGKGSTFYLEIPLVETFAIKEESKTQEVAQIKEAIPAIITTQTPPTLTTIQKSTILIVEDNPDLRAYLTLILEEKYNIITAENGKEALEQLQVDSSELQVDTAISSIKSEANPQPTTRNLPAKVRQGGPQLIISDIMMPIMNGIELLTQLKMSDDYRHIPVIMLTARKSLDVKIEALRIGVDDYLTKPFRNEELIARVVNLIANSQSRLSAAPDEAPVEQSKVSAADLKWIQLVEETILENVENPRFNINDLCTRLNISNTHLRRKIKKITGLTTKQYERTIKLAKARKFLKSGDYQTVLEVIYRLGYDNHYYFSKIYKEMYGVMPSEELK